MNAEDGHRNDFKAGGAAMTLGGEKNAVAMALHCGKPGGDGRFGLANRFQPAADGWIQLAPLGLFPHGKDLVQAVDAQALEALSNAFAGDLLLDFDHESDDPKKRTTAAGWIDALEAREDGLWGHVRWSAAGSDAVRNGEYRFVSPVWEVEAATDIKHKERRVVRPVRLVEAGLTNKPNLRGLRPLSNRESGQDARAPLKDFGAPCASGNQENKPMKLINRALDLTPEASEEAAVAKLEALKTTAAEAKELKNRVEALTQERDLLLASQVEADLEKFKNRLSAESLPKWKAALLANRAETLELLEGIPTPTPAPKQALTNRHATGTPADKPAEGEGKDLSTLRNRAVAEFRAANKCDFETAWNAVRVAKPELFTEETLKS
jgi:phage I-like protein